VRVRWLLAALQNLDEEAEYIARDNAAAAARVVTSIEESVRHLASHLAMGRPGRIPGTRELVVPNSPYVVPYRVRGDAVEILRVFHGKRKWPRKL
jgi:toxin ParE1/3/4